MQRIVGKNAEGLNRVYGILDNIQWDKQFNPQGTQWYSKDEHGIQVSQMRYNKGKLFKAHRHNTYPRTAPITQECMVLLQGKMRYKMWDDRQQRIADGVLLPNQVLIIYGGWHEFEILENNTIAIETKNGPYTDVATDKVYMDIV